MLTQIEISNYRGFRSYRLRALTQVNLLVGKNNSGKSALLEILHFLASGGDPDVLVEIARRRGEVSSEDRGSVGFIDVSHFFHGHEVSLNSALSVAGDNGLPGVTVKAVPLSDKGPSIARMDPDLRVFPAFALEIRGGRHRAKKEDGTLFLSEAGALLYDPHRSPRRYLGELRSDGPPIVFITPESMGSESLGRMWNLVLREKREAEVRRALQILEPGLEDIVFETGESSSRYTADRSNVLVSTKGSSRRFPLGSMGDGMRRLLALSISLIRAQGGFLFMDEIDTGFHHSIMSAMWRLVIDTAKTYQIQVFATTHSLDCTRGLAEVCMSDSDLAQSVSAHKIDRRLESDVAYPGHELVAAVAHEMELR